MLQRPQLPSVQISSSQLSATQSCCGSHPWPPRLCYRNGRGLLQCLASNPTPCMGGRKPALAAAEKQASALAHTLCAADLMWAVEHHLDKDDIVLADTDPRQTVHIFGCRNCTIQVKGRVGAVTVEQCVRTGVVLGDLVSMCRLVNSQALDVHVKGHVPTIAVYQCDDVQVRVTGHMPTIAVDNSNGVKLCMLLDASPDAAVTVATGSEADVAKAGAMPAGN